MKEDASIAILKMVKWRQEKSIDRIKERIQAGMTQGNSSEYTSAQAKERVASDPLVAKSFLGLELQCVVENLLAAGVHDVLIAPTGVCKCTTRIHRFHSASICLSIHVPICSCPRLVKCAIVCVCFATADVNRKQTFDELDSHIHR